MQGDANLTVAIIGVLTGLSGLIAAITAYVKSKTTSGRGESMEAEIKALKEQNKAQEATIKELKDLTRDLPTVRTKLDNDFRNIQELQKKTESQGIAITSVSQRVETVEKLVEKVDRLTEIVISVRTLIENKGK